MTEAKITPGGRIIKKLEEETGKTVFDEDFEEEASEAMSHKMANATEDQIKATSADLEEAGYKLKVENGKVIFERKISPTYPIKEPIKDDVPMSGIKDD